MALSLESIVVGSAEEPPRITVYGPGGVGKTTLAAGAPKPVFIPTEKGKGRLNIASFPLARRYEDVTDALACLASEDHEFKTVVVDTLDWLETLIHEKLCRDEGKESIEDFGYGKGYVKVLPYWAEFLSALDYLHDERGMVIVLLAHSAVKTVNNPDGENYDQYQLKLHKEAFAKIFEWSDAVLFANYEIKVRKIEEGPQKGKGKAARMSQVPRLLHTELRPGFQAKNRYGLPPTLPFPKDGAWELLESAITSGFAVPEEEGEEEAAEVAAG